VGVVSSALLLNDVGGRAVAVERTLEILPAFEGVRILVRRGDCDGLIGNGGSLDRGELLSEKSARANGLDFG
jgi:hypothetical protein